MRTQGEQTRMSGRAPSRGRTVKRRYVLTGAVAMAAGGVVWWLASPQSGTGGVTTDQYGDRVQTLPRGPLPEFARSGGPEVEQVYRFALEQGEALESVPCFCGCVKIGHRHNRDCYIKSVNRDGTITYTSHGAT